MANPTGLIKRLDRVFAKYNITDRAVYKRLLSRGGGDPLIGRHGTVTVTDTKLDPQPVVSIPSDSQLMVNGQRVVLASDYLLLVSVSTLTAQDLSNKDTVIVFKTADTEEECAVVTYTPTVLQGTVLLHTVLARSKKR